VSVAGRDEYLQRAAQCVLIAEETDDPARRVLLLEMAQAWSRLAQQVDAANGKPDQPEPDKPEPK